MVLWTLEERAEGESSTLEDYIEGGRDNILSLARARACRTVAMSQQSRCYTILSVKVEVEIPRETYPAVIL